jgi:hypothetical protein
MKQVWLLGITLLLVGIAFGQVSKQETDKKLAPAIAKINEIAKDPAIVAAIKEQNARKMQLADIQLTDKLWMDQKDTLSATMLKNACSQRLQEIVKAEGGLFSESFAMDQQGANACMSSRTSDYWQGDEPKWQKAFNGGKGATFIDERKYDSSARAVLVQVSVPVMSAGKVIGTLTVGVNIDKLSAK